MRVLVVDDHPETRQLVARKLELASHGVKTAGSCTEAEEMLAASRFDVMVLDVMLPDGSGIELCARLRGKKLDVPILLLTARGEVKSRVSGLEAGADDYLAKPFAISELRARVMALGRRGPMLRGRALTLGPLVVDLEGRQVRIEGQNIPLTAKELAIINLLATRHGQVVPRDELIESVWGEVTPAARASLDVLMGRIRRKFGTTAPMLRTLRGVGYTLDHTA